MSQFKPANGCVKYDCNMFSFGNHVGMIHIFYQLAFVYKYDPRMCNLWFVFAVRQVPVLSAFQKHVVSSGPCGAPGPWSTGPGGRGSGVGHFLLRTRLGFIVKLHSMCCSRFWCQFNNKFTGTASSLYLISTQITLPCKYINKRLVYFLSCLRILVTLKVL